MTYKNGEVVINFDKPYTYRYYRKLIQRRPCFYVVKPVVSSKLDFVKIGKSSDALLRLDQYSRVWKVEFKILYLAYFRDFSSSRSVHIENETSRIFRDLKDKFERDVIEQLKLDGVEPYYSQVSNEFYPLKKLDGVIKAIETVKKVNENTSQATRIVKNKASQRVAKNRYNLRSKD